MSLHLSTKWLSCLGISAILWLALPATGWAQVFGVPYAGGGGACAPCASHHCPPHYHVYVQGPPRMCWHRTCPKPICNPCDLPHFGYFETCWSPWPYPADFGHCIMPPPAAYVTLNPLVNPNLPLSPPTVLPPPGPNFPATRPPAFPGTGGIPPIIDQIIEFPPPRKGTGGN